MIMIGVCALCSFLTLIGYALGVPLSLVWDLLNTILTAKNSAALKKLGEIASDITDNQDKILEEVKKLESEVSKTEEREKEMVELCNAIMAKDRSKAKKVLDAIKDWGPVIASILTRLVNVFFPV